MEESLGKAPVFIKIEQYKDVHEIVGVIKEKVNNIDKALARIKEIKTREDSELAAWKSSLQNAKAKISEIDDNLLDPDL